MANPLAGDIEIPKVGSVPKAVVIPVAGAAAAYVAWRYWQARNTAAYDPEAETAEYEDPGTIPGVTGAYSDTNSYGLASSEPVSTSDYGFTGTTNSQWSQYVTDRLVASETWSYTSIVSALGAFLGNKALSTTEQQIVQAGIALAGNPPEGTHAIIPGGDVAITVAPTGLAAATVTTTSVDLTWSAVPGATGYRVYRSGASENVGASADTKAHIGGLQPGTKYTFTVAAVGAGSAVGPKSSAVSVTTKTVTLKAPTGLTATAVTKNSVTLKWNAVADADFYRIYMNGVARNTSEDTTHTVGALKAKTKYTVEVKADSTGGSAGPAAKITITTKK